MARVNNSQSTYRATVTKQPTIKTFQNEGSEPRDVIFISARVNTGSSGEDAQGNTQWYDSIWLDIQSSNPRDVERFGSLQEGDRIIASGAFYLDQNKSDEGVTYYNPKLLTGGYNTNGWIEKIDPTTYGQGASARAGVTQASSVPADLEEAF